MQNFDIEKLRLINRLNFIMAKSPFLELSDTIHSTNGLQSRVALKVETLHQDFAIEACDFSFTQIFQDFKDLQPESTDPLLLLGIFELFIGGLLKKGSSYIQQPIEVKDYIVNFNSDDFLDHIAFYLKFKEHKYACTLHIPNLQSRRALLQLLDSLLTNNLEWFEKSAVNVIEPSMMQAIYTSENGSHTLLHELAHGTHISQILLDNLLFPLSFTLGRTQLSLKDLSNLKVGDAIVLDESYFKQNLLDVISHDRHTFAQVDLQQRQIILNDDLTPRESLTTTNIDKIDINQPSANLSPIEQNEDTTLSQENTTETTADEQSLQETSSPLPNLDNLKLELCFELERRYIKLGELKTLKKGSILALNDTDLSHVAVMVNNQLVARGQIIDLESNCALQLTEIFNQN